jgi:nucleotide-binding universal stress UspA family protein
VIGLRADELDSAQLDYLQFFLSKVPVRAAHFVHIVTEEALQQLERASSNTLLSSRYQSRMKLLQQMRMTIEQSNLLNESVEVDCRLIEGNVLHELLAAIQKHKADLVVIGNKAQADSGRLLEKALLDKSDSRLLLIPDEAPKRLHRLLVPIDFSIHSVEALRTAIRISQALKTPCEITCIHPLSDSRYLFQSGVSLSKKMKNIIASEERNKIEAFLDHFQEGELQHVEAKALSSQKTNLAEALLAYAHEEEMDLIVMGGDRHGAIELVQLSELLHHLLTANTSIPSLIV